jgi:2-keto-myo-inositol isomerase
MEQHSRRDLLARAGAGLALGAASAAGWSVTSGAASQQAEAAVGTGSNRNATDAAGQQQQGKQRSAAEPFGYCLNTSTIRGQKVPIEQEVDLVARAGYDAIEPWINELDAYVKQGGSLKDLAKRIKDQGLFVPSAIGFAEWIVDDEGRRAKGLEQAKRDMDMVAQLGGVRIAAPPVGAQRPNDPTIDLLKAAERYRALVEVGDRIGVIPMIEVWGFSKNLSRLGHSTAVAIESQHPKALVLADAYHLYKGGSDFVGMNFLSSDVIEHFHINDYPDNPPRAQIADKHRVYPGDGVAPLNDLFRGLRAIGFRGTISLELFNEDYYKQDAFQVLKTGLEKTRAAVQKALG